MIIQIRKKILQTRDERGVSLLIVLLIGTVILMTSIAVGQYATRMVQSLRARSDAVQTLYFAESTFECVKYWLNQDHRAFSTISGNTQPTVTCNGQNFNFNTGSPAGTSYNSSTGVGTFTLDADPLPGTVRVEVDRTNPAQQLFDGYVRVYSQSALSSSAKNTERFQEYYYRLLYGADIMFVVDRSGSIDDGGDRSDRTLDNEWNDLLSAVNSSIRLLSRKVPAPHIGIVSFGTDGEDTGQQVSPSLGECAGSGSTDCSLASWLVPDVQLVDASANLSSLIDDQGTTGVGNEGDDVPEMNLDYASTNLSLGLSIAGAELMGKYYPYSGLGVPPAGTLGTYARSGAFERIVARGESFSNLPDQGSPADRDDNDFPDVIVIITDGAPNGIMTHVGRNNYWYDSITLGPPNFLFISPTRADFPVGSAKLMRTPTPGSGRLIVDYDSSVGASYRYNYCHDAGGSPSSLIRRPSGYFSSDSSYPYPTARLNSNTYPHYAMCNGTMIANKLKNDEDIKIIGIFVGPDPDVVPPPKEAHWMRDWLVSVTDDGEPLFAHVGDYTEVQDAIMYLFERLDLVQSR